MKVKEEKVLTDVTVELLERTNIIKENIKKSMMVGEYNILKGVVIFDVILKEVNPEVISDDVIIKISDMIDLYTRDKEEQMQKINQRMHYGINKCLTMLYLYNKSIKRLSYQK